MDTSLVQYELLGKEQPAYRYLIKSTKSPYPAKARSSSGNVIPTDFRRFAF